MPQIAIVSALVGRDKLHRPSHETQDRQEIETNSPESQKVQRMIVQTNRKQQLNQTDLKDG